MEDSLFLTEDSPCSPDRRAVELDSDEENSEEDDEHETLGLPSPQRPTNPGSAPMEAQAGRLEALLQEEETDDESDDDEGPALSLSSSNIGFARARL
eukprot:symbB.v1.2.002979.t1/scaffold165.1/size289678/12